MMEERQRTYLDVSALPRHPFGPRNITWWGNIGFMVIEGTSLVMCAATYLYLRRNFNSWPPLRTPPPDLLIPTLSLIALLISTALAHMEGKAAKRADLPGVRSWGIFSLAASFIAIGFRAAEFTALNTRWDHDAYGSILWFTIGLHATLLLLQFLEDAFFLLLAHVGPVDPEFYPHVEERAEYAYFLAGIWIPLFILLYLGPRFL